MPTLTPLQLDWKVGDRALYDCQEVTIDRLDEYGGSVAYGGIIMSFHSSRAHLFPVTDEGVAIAKVFRDLYDGLRERPGAGCLNYPTIADHVRNMFNTAMKTLHEEGKTAAAMYLGDVFAFFNAAKNELAKAYELEVKGIPLIRR